MASIFSLIFNFQTGLRSLDAHHNGTLTPVSTPWMLLIRRSGSSSRLLSTGVIYNNDAHVTRPDLEVTKEYANGD